MNGQNFKGKCLITGGIAFLCSFLLVNAPLKAMGRLFKFSILNQRKSRATSFWDGPLRIQGNWPDWPPSTGVNFQPCRLYCEVCFSHWLDILWSPDIDSMGNFGLLHAVNLLCVLACQCFQDVNVWMSYNLVHTYILHLSQMGSSE